MSSNLLKQQYGYNEQAGARIINSNQRMEERMRELARIYQAADDGNELSAPKADFVEGILAEEVQEEPKIDTEALIAEAQAEADRIVAEARDRADQMLNDANAKAQNLYETQKQAGYDDGAALAREELEKQSIDHQEQYRKQCQELEADYRTKQESMEADLVDAIIQVFDKVFHIQFGNKKEILLYLIKNTLGSIDAGKHFRILVSEDNWKYVDEHLDELREELGSDVTIETARDRSMNDTDCRIETDFGVYDCGVDLELDALCRDIRSLCS